MNIADFPTGFATIHVRRTDYVPPRIIFPFYKLETAFEVMRFLHAHNPLATYDIEQGGKVLAELPKRQNHVNLRLLKRRAA